MMKVEGFIIQELVPEKVYNMLGEDAWGLFSEDAKIGLTWLRKHLGVCYINNWHTGGNYSQSGYRTVEHFISEVRKKYKTLDEASVLVFANKLYEKSGSRHKYGFAFDCKFLKYTAEEARQYIKKHWDLPFPITLEEGVSWCHVDFRDWDDCEVHSFNP